MGTSPCAKTPRNRRFPVRSNPGLPTCLSPLELRATGRAELGSVRGVQSKPGYTQDAILGREEDAVLAMRAVEGNVRGSVFKGRRQSVRCVGIVWGVCSEGGGTTTSVLG
jgi:hypothetical protein